MTGTKNGIARRAGDMLLLHDATEGCVNRILHSLLCSASSLLRYPPHTHARNAKRRFRAGNVFSQLASRRTHALRAAAFAV